MSDTWDRWGLDLAAIAAGRSKDPSTQTGAAILDDYQRLVSVGFNGFPRGILDDDRLRDRDTKLSIIIHAEVNAILFANRSLEGCTIYVSPWMPCSNCAAVIIQAGIKRVVSPIDGKVAERWAAAHALSLEILEEAGVECVTI